jgi:hypothetical protein
MPSASARIACLTCSGLPLPWADSGGPTPSATTHVVSDRSSARHRRRCRPGPMGDCGPWGDGAGEELLDETLFCTAGHKPNRDCGPRRGPRRNFAVRHSTTKPHRPRAHRTRAVSGLRERRAGARVKPRQEPHRGLGRSRGPHVDRRSGTVSERSRGR